MVNRDLELAGQVKTYPQFDQALIKCRACPRLVKWREKVAKEKRASFQDQEYWGAPVPGFGDTKAWLLVLGLAPAAHGGNRTGRIFTGDRSGDWLFAAMFRAGFGNQPESISKDDGLKLIGARVTAAVHCAPPGNAPTPSEKQRCANWLDGEMRLLGKHLQAILALGAFAWGAALDAASRHGYQIQKPKPKFGHGVTVTLHPEPGSKLKDLALVGSYHPSQQNTFTGRLTEPMLDEVFSIAKRCHT